MIVVVGPGQGSQTPGMLEPWLADRADRAYATGLADAAGFDLVRHGTTSDADTIRDTAVAQPLIVGAGLIAWRALQRAAGDALTVDATAGHSVGEFTAAVVAGILADTESMSLVHTRGIAMAEAARAVKTGMSAVVGGDEADVLARLDALGLFPANYNGGGQLVAAGDLDALARLKDEPPAGARVLPLQVAGAFHTSYMQPAVEKLSAAADTAVPADPVRTIWTNRDGSAVTSGADFIDCIVGQVSSPVRWDLVMAAMVDAGVTGLVELAPGGTLVGLAKRAMKGVPTVAIKTPDDLPAAIDLIGTAA